MDDQLVTKYYNSGLRYAKAERWDEAIEILNRAIVENPKHVLSYNILGKAYMETGKADAARRCWHTALRLNPDNKTARQLLVAAGREPIFSRLEALLKSVPIREILWPVIAAVLLVALIISNTVWLSRVRSLKAELANPGAEQNIPQNPPAEKTQEIEPATPETDEDIERIYNQGFEACQSKQYDRAIEKFQQVLAYPPAHELKDNAQYWLAECYYAQGEFARATVEFQKVKQYFPEASKVFDAELKIAYTYYNLGRVESARHKLLQLSSEWPQKQYQSQINVLLELIRAKQSE
jgi:tetratricopeptide (TPR) repeat protein